MNKEALIIVSLSILSCEISRSNASVHLMKPKTFNSLLRDQIVKKLKAGEVVKILSFNSLLRDQFAYGLVEIVIIF